LPEEGKFYYSPDLDHCFQTEVDGATLDSVFTHDDRLILRIGFSSATGRLEEMDIAVRRDGSTHKASDLVMKSEAPISSFVLDEDNKLWAHPRAFRDVSAREFRQLADFDLRQQRRSLFRSIKVIDRHPDMTYVPNWKTVVPFYAMKAFDKAAEMSSGSPVIREYARTRWQNSQKVIALN